MEHAGLDQPVTRREFEDFASKITSKIDELFRARQVSWPLIISFAGLGMGAVGFAIKNMVETAVVKSIAESTARDVDNHSPRIGTLETALAATSETAKGNAGAISEIRERVRATEANLRAVQIENETQNRWAADVANLQASHLEALMRVHHPDLPASGYWPFAGIGDAGVLNGKH